MRITVDEAREYFLHPSQQKASRITPEELPEDGVQYWAQGGVCGLFHMAHWPDVWMAHYAVKPEFWGRSAGDARAVLSEFWKSENPHLIVGWTDEDNRAALSFARRIGFREHGRMAMPEQIVIEQSWRPEWASEQQ